MNLVVHGAGHMYTVSAENDVSNTVQSLDRTYFTASAENDVSNTFFWPTCDDDDAIFKIHIFLT